MNEIKLSVIVPVYNTEKYLQQCLDSILSQTLHELEVICVDDGSTDSSPQILQYYSQKDSRVRIITKENDGLGAARNTGIEAAHGEYIGFVDSDDVIDQDYFGFLYQTAVANAADVILGNINLYFDDTGLEKVFQDCTMLKVSHNKETFSAFDVPEIVERIGVWDRIYKREFISKYNLRNPEHVIYEDAPFSFQTLVLAERISLCSDAVYKYRKNTGIAITDKEVWNDKYKFDFVKNARSIKLFLQSEGVYDIYKPYFLRYFIKNALWHQSNFMKYEEFRRFWHEVTSIITKQECNEILADSKHMYPWKSKIYTFLLFLENPRICYIAFWKKRIRRKRS